MPGCGRAARRECDFLTGFTAPTALYLSLFAVMLGVHAVFMRYVLAGSTYLAIGRLIGPRRCAVRGWQSILVDWLPFATGLAITAGVAPLLFVQILYVREFSTANLLLSHRWMAILPVLVVCFYLLFLQKSSWLARHRWVWRTVVASLACSGFIFIAWSWTENHLLMLDRDAWVPHYESGALRYASRECFRGSRSGSFRRFPRWRSNWSGRGGSWGSTSRGHRPLPRWCSDSDRCGGWRSRRCRVSRE